MRFVRFKARGTTRNVSIVAEHIIAVVETDLGDHSTEIIVRGCEQPLLVNEGHDHVVDKISKALK